MGDGEPKGFKVTDRRSFLEEEDGAAPAEATAKPEAAAQTREKPAPSPTPQAPAVDTHSRGPLPPVDFQTFVISVGSSALLSMGEMEDPETGKRQVDLTLAKHNIDLLAMLEEKTRNNLTDNESRLLSSLLYDLRVRFVELARGASSR